MSREIALSQGYVAIVDDEDFDALSVHRWYAMVGRGGYAVAYRTVRVCGRKTSLLMHRQIMGAAPGRSVDHINRNALDNRRANLRFASQQQNCVNRLYPNATGFRGVAKHRDKFIAQASVSGRVRRIGSFASAIEAARAYDEFARAQHGDFAVLNFPLQPGDLHAAADAPTGGVALPLAAPGRSNPLPQGASHE